MRSFKEIVMIRKYKPEDLNAIMAVWLESNIEAHHFIRSQYWKENYDQVKVLLPQAIIFVYEKKGVVLGFIGLNDHFIEGLFVKPSEQSKGVGQALLNYVKESKTSLVLHVYKNNERAVRFYLKEGFNITGEHFDQNVRQDECVMEWRVR